MKQKLTSAERTLYEWQYNKLGSFMNRLMELISRADRIHSEKLFQAYPDLVVVYSKYAHEKGYWGAVKIRYTEMLNGV